jgi:hypothetical protein
VLLLRRSRSSRFLDKDLQGDVPQEGIVIAIAITILVAYNVAQYGRFPKPRDHASVSVFPQGNVSETRGLVP